MNSGCVVMLPRKVVLLLSLSLDGLVYYNHSLEDESFHLFQWLSFVAVRVHAIIFNLSLKKCIDICLCVSVCLCLRVAIWCAGYHLCCLCLVCLCAYCALLVCNVADVSFLKRELS